MKFIFPTKKQMSCSDTLLYILLFLKHKCNACWLFLVYRFFCPLTVLRVALFCEHVLVSDLPPDEFLIPVKKNHRLFMKMKYEALVDKNLTLVIQYRFGMCGRIRTATDQMIVPSMDEYKQLRLFA